MIGKIISHYKILEKLGSGGMGVVYKAHDSKLDRVVALKFLPSSLIAKESDKARFLQEAKAASALNHPNVCTIYEIQDQTEQPFISMEYVEGKTLRKIVGELDNKLLPINDIIDYTTQIGEALKAAHDKGIVHRDVKTDNIMVTKTGQIKVMDFGLAKLRVSAGLTKSSSTLGTTAYVSPESLQGKEVDARADIFSFGVVLYELLSGHLPFKGEYDSAVMYSIVNEEPEPIQQYRSDISSELLHILNRALEKDPENRYQTMNDLIIDLHRLKRDTEGTSKLSNNIYSSEIISKEKNKIKRKKIIVPAIILFVIIVSLIGYFLTFQVPEDFEPIPIAVIDFVNETDEPELNGLSGMLITALEQSKRLSVLTRSRMFDILKQLKISEIDRIDESLGRRICKEAKVNTLAAATIRKFGKLYTIDFKVLNVDKNEYLFTSKEVGEGQESIPTMIDNLSENIRKGLKEKVSEIKASTTNIAEITSSNLEAYQHYFKGEEYINKMKFDPAREEFKKAIKLDSTFGLAYYRMAYAYDWEANPQQSAQYIIKAISMLNRIPEKDRYLVRAEHARLEKGMGAGIAILEDMKQIYPDDKEMLYNIGDWSWHVGDFMKAQQYLEKVLAIDPTFVRALQHLTWTYRDLGLYEKMLNIAKSYVAVSESKESFNLLVEAYMLTGEFETGLKSLKQTRELHPDRYYLSTSIASMYVLQAQYKEAEKELKILVEKDKPVEIQQLGNEYLASFYPYVGKYRGSIQACDKVIGFYWQSKDTSLASYWQLVKGLIKAEGWNDVDAAWEEAEKTFHFQNQINYLFYWPTLSLLYILRGDFDLADRLAANFTDVKWWHLTVRSLIQTEKQECNKAESLADTVLQIGRGFAKILVLYSLAECQYEQGELDKAANNLLQLQRIYDNSFSMRAWYYPKSFYLLGKIYERKSDRNLALKNYKKFLDIWKNADNDLPELIDAKKRLTKLESVVVQ